MIFGRKCAALLIAAAAPLARTGASDSSDGNSTSASNSTREWLLRHSDVQCEAAIMPGQDFIAEAEARDRCEELAELCFGIYDVGCHGDTYFLCQRDRIASAEGLAHASDGSCVSELSVASTFEPRPALAPARQEEEDEGDVCLKPCTMPEEEALKTCREQILEYTPRSTGSEPAEVIPCDRRRLIVSHGGECQICAGCSVCEEDGNVESDVVAELEDLQEVHHAATARSDGAWPWILAAGTAATGCAAALVALRRRAPYSRQEEEGQQFLDLEPTLLVE